MIPQTRARAGWRARGSAQPGDGDFVARDDDLLAADHRVDERWQAGLGVRQSHG
ncbi:MAG: hypothetical protein WBD40_23695 [Tepidisphaeraceae bacterium]